MRRTGRVILILLILLSCMMAMWIFQAWREERRNGSEEVYHNVYITDASGTSISVIREGEEQFESLTPVSEGAVEGLVADLYLRDKKITKIVKKPEYVTGTIQKIQEGKITLDEYGEVELAEEFALYHIGRDGTVTRGEEDDLTVGQPKVRFTAAGKQICAAVIPEIQVDKIRVLLYDSDFSSYDHKKVVLTADTDYTVRQKGGSETVRKGKTCTLEPDKVSGDIVVRAGDKGKIKVESLKRQSGTPCYRGTLRISKSGNALHIVNELPLEEYLYSVVPSEMPTEYNMEALKAQAVCARSYAVKQMKGKRLASYGAHVDDSVSFQVYNNQSEDSRSIEAVNATKGQVVTYGNKIASTYFYSASCGSRAGTKDVWLAKKDEPYLPSGSLTGDVDLSQEKSFVSFIGKSPKSLDSDSPWYRWRAEVPAEQLTACVEEKLPGRLEANRTQIQVRQSDGSYRSEDGIRVGTVRNIAVAKRGRGGVLTAVEIEGSEHTIRVYTEYNIRTLLGDSAISYVRNDGQTVGGLNLLPSGFFTVKKKGKNFVFTGGGYGHGVGMSQNGANAMAAKGKSCQDILTFYFPGTSVEERGAAG